jgi:hypothetical protein
VLLTLLTLPAAVDSTPLHPSATGMPPKKTYYNMLA